MDNHGNLYFTDEKISVLHQEGLMFLYFELNHILHKRFVVSG